MLNRQNKSKSKNKSKKQSSNSPDNIESFKTWIRKIEQSTNSISSRLAAVEKRITLEKSKFDENHDTFSLLKKPVEKILDNLENKEKEIVITEIANNLDSELIRIRQDLINHEQDLDQLKGQLSKNLQILDELQKNVNNFQVAASRIINDLRDRTERIERRAPPMMKLGKTEIPIEITGVIGGIIVILISILITQGFNEIVLSPWFLFIIGCVLISSAVIKTLNMKSEITKKEKKIYTTS